jgi:hypothetical protein
MASRRCKKSLSVTRSMASLGSEAADFPGARRRESQTSLRVGKKVQDLLNKQSPG